MLVWISLFLFFVSVFLALSQKNHFLSVLLVLELMTLSLFIMVLSFVSSGVSFSGMGFGIVFLVFGVYEAANGLGLLVSRTRSSGMDQLSALFSLSF